MKACFLSFCLTSRDDLLSKCPEPGIWPQSLGSVLQGNKQLAAYSLLKGPEGVQFPEQSD